jgi:hypothetical protein
MYEDKEIWTVRDGSKLRQNRVALNWDYNDLYGFLWHWLATSDDADARRAFARIVKATTGIQLPRLRGENLVVLDNSLVADDIVQSKLFTRIAGEFMGADKRKGFTYTWIPNHLSDSKGRVSLRSFMIALREAANAIPPTAATPITPEPIQSQLRLAFEQHH